MSKTREDGTSRRNFLKLAGTAAPAAVAAVAVSGEAQASETAGDETRLKDTAHTRAYLKSARF